MVIAQQSAAFHNSHPELAVAMPGLSQSQKKGVEYLKCDQSLADCDLFVLQTLTACQFQLRSSHGHIQISVAYG